MGLGFAILIICLHPHSRLTTAFWRYDLSAELPLMAVFDHRSPTQAEVHGVICPDLIEYSVIPASPQSAAAAGLTVCSDILNCLER